MALKRNISSSYGIDVNGAITKVENITFENKLRMRFFAKTYAKEGFPPISSDQHAIDHDLSGPNAYEQAYSYLKSLPDYSDAIDV